jgi:hypothetical protein
VNANQAKVSLLQQGSRQTKILSSAMAKYALEGYFY